MIRHIATPYEITAANEGRLRSLLVRLYPQPPVFAGHFEFIKGQNCGWSHVSPSGKTGVLWVDPGFKEGDRFSLAEPYVFFGETIAGNEYLRYSEEEERKRVCKEKFDVSVSSKFDWQPAETMPEDATPHHFLVKDVRITQGIDAISEIAAICGTGKVIPDVPDRILEKIEAPYSVDDWYVLIALEAISQ